MDREIEQIDQQIRTVEESLKKSKNEPPKAEQVDSISPTVSSEIRESLDDRLKRLKSERKSWSEKRSPFTFGLLMREQTAAPPPIFVFYQGDPKAPKQPVEPGFPTAFQPGPAVEPLSPRAPRRLMLADWIVSPQNPWTARVLVNRMWQMYYGEGLVATANDFGISGATPSDPKLLDWLASELMDHWSIKRLSRQIAVSAAYRQAVLAGGSRPGVASAHTRLRRLSAEQTRDCLLACSGLIQHRTGGPAVWPELPPEILQANPAFLDDNETKTKGWYPSAYNEQTVRSLYLIQKRTVRIPFLETLDLPENSVSCARRESSIVAPQALSLLNSTLSVQAAEAMAGLCAAASDGDPWMAIEYAFDRTLQRAPTEPEARIAMDFLNQHSLVELCRALLNTNELMFIP